MGCTILAVALGLTEFVVALNEHVGSLREGSEVVVHVRVEAEDAMPAGTRTRTRAVRVRRRGRVVRRCDRVPVPRRIRAKKRYIKRVRRWKRE